MARASLGAQGIRALLRQGFGGQAATPPNAHSAMDGAIDAGPQLEGSRPRDPLQPALATLLFSNRLIRAKKNS